MPSKVFIKVDFPIPLKPVIIIFSLGLTSKEILGRSDSPLYPTSKELTFKAFLLVTGKDFNLK